MRWCECEPYVFFFLSLRFLTLLFFLFLSVSKCSVSQGQLSTWVWGLEVGCGNILFLCKANIIYLSSFCLLKNFLGYTNVNTLLKNEPHSVHAHSHAIVFRHHYRMMSCEPRKKRHQHGSWAITKFAVSVFQFVDACFQRRSNSNPLGMKKIWIIQAGFGAPIPRPLLMSVGTLFWVDWILFLIFWQCATFPQGIFHGFKR